VSSASMIVPVVGPLIRVITKCKLTRNKCNTLAYNPFHVVYFFFISHTVCKKTNPTIKTRVKKRLQGGENERTLWILVPLSCSL